MGNARQGLYLTWLGQAGYVVELAGQRLAIDPYLSDSVTRLAPELARLYPPPLEPSALQVDALLVTHDHLDHLDPETIGALPRPWPTFIGPRNVRRHLLALDVPAERIVQVDAGDEVTWQGITVRATFAIPNEETVLDSVGFLLSVAGQPCLYHSGDTAYHPFLHYLAHYRPPVALLCINGKYGNMGYEQAAQLARALGVRVAIPNHYDLFALNSEDPERFRAALTGASCTEVLIPRLNEPYDLSAYLEDH